MQVITERTLDVSADAVWNLLGNRFADIGKWASAVEASHLDGALESGSVRTCELKPTNIGSGTIQERIAHFDRDRRELTYDILSGLPGFMKFVQNAWVITPTADGRARVRSVLTLNLAWYMLPMSFAIKSQFRKTLSGFIDEMEQNAEAMMMPVEAVSAAE